VTDQSACTIDTFCAAEKISRSMFYKLKSQGKAPRLYYIGNVPRISHEARIEWRRKREAETADIAATGAL
jgi:hypothetical protein